MDTFIDLTEFFERPNRTGIQRVCGELCVHWPHGRRLIPVRVNKNGRLILLPNQTLDLIKAFFKAGPSEAKTLLRGFRRRFTKPIAFNSIDKLLVPEVFLDPVRIAFYEAALKEWASKIFFLVFDLCPLLAPELYLPGSGGVIFPYYRLIRHVTHVGFISKSTRTDYFTRLLRRGEPNGPVFYLGSDGLGPRSTTMEWPKERVFSVLSTIEPRKNHAVILDAFEELWREFPDLELNFIGRMGWVDAAFSSRVAAAACKNPRFRWFDSLEDQAVRRLVEKSRATIYLSAKEGFGLPPVESLWLGVPVITNGVPSVEALGDQGIYRIKELHPGSLKEAVTRFLDDGFWAKKKHEAMGLPLPTWKSFAGELAGWIEGSR